MKSATDVFPAFNTNGDCSFWSRKMICPDSFDLARRLVQLTRRRPFWTGWLSSAYGFYTFSTVAMEMCFEDFASKINFTLPPGQTVEDCVRGTGFRIQSQDSRSIVLEPTFARTRQTKECAQEFDRGLLKEGMVVKLHGLKTQRKLNGKRAKIIGKQIIKNGVSRWPIRLLTGKKSEALLKGSNLRQEIKTTKAIKFWNNKDAEKGVKVGSRIEI